MNLQKSGAYLGRRYYLWGLLWALSMLCSLHGTAAIAFSTGTVQITPWGNASYSYQAERIALQRVLTDFGKHFGVNTQIDPRLKDIVNGIVSAANPDKFLDELGERYGFDWYFARGTLYVSPITQRINKVLNVPRPLLGQIKPALRDMGLFYERFGWGELPAQGTIALSGPLSYVNLVEEVIRSLITMPSEQKIAVFRLKYASVQDRVIAYRDQQITVPGIETMIRRLAGDFIAPLQNTENDGSTVTSTAQTQNTGSHSNTAGEVNIQADVRLNALIVKAPPAVLPLYAQLIKELDIAVPLIQIEATIVDVDNDTSEELGVDWMLSKGKHRSAISNSGNPLEGGADLSNLRPNLVINTILPSSFNLLARVHALEKKGRAKVISMPSILGMDNTPALLDMSDTYYILNRGERVVETTPVSVGLLLKVTPRVVEGPADQLQRIVLQLDIEDGRNTSAGISNALPTIKRSTISTQTMVSNGDSLLIAGHQRNEVQQNNRQVPLLGSLPVIGALFKHTSEAVSNRTRYFVITPRIVQGPNVPPSFTIPVATAPTLDDLNLTPTTTLDLPEPNRIELESRNVG